MNNLSGKIYDLEARTARFAIQVRTMLRSFPRSALTQQDIVQLLRSSGSIGANYIEANEALGTKDFLMHIKISRKEAKETAYWLFLLLPFQSDVFSIELKNLRQEAKELERIFAAIMRKTMLYKGKLQ